MKLSMWNLANALAALDPEVSIRPDSPMVLRSGRLAWATNCVQVRQDGPDCLCLWESDSIRIRDMDALEGVELVQSVFDAMNDWYADLREAAEARDYQRLVDRCHVVLHSPVLLCDENGCVLGISACYGADEVDGEWRYLKTYGYASMRGIENVQTVLGPVAVSNEVVRLPHRSSGRFSAGLTTRVFRGGQPLGRLTVLERERHLNRGDVQIVQQIAALLAVNLQPEQTGGKSGGAYLDRLMAGQTLGETAWEHLYRTRGWLPEHTYRLWAFGGGGQETSPLRETLGRTVHQAICTAAERQLWILTNETQGGRTLPEKLETLAADNGLHLACSLPGPGVAETVQWAEQVRYAMERSTAAGVLEPFSACAVDYLLWGTREAAQVLAACHPDARRLWQAKQDGEPMLYDTLRAYLDLERGANRTAAALSIHKNTLFYRLHKLEEMLTADLEDPLTRLHLQLSFRILEQQKNDRL